MNRKIVIFIFIFVGVLMTGCASYSKEVKKSLQRSYGQTFSQYIFRGNPVGNFGVGTIYSNKISSSSVDLKKVANTPADWLLAHPSSWYVSGVSDDEKKLLNAAIFPEGSMGTVKIKESISNELKLNVAVPNLAQVLDGGAKLDYKKGVKVTIKASDATNRQLNLSELKEAINNNKIKTYVKTYLDSNEIIVCAQDIILNGYSAEIEVDININPELNAKLNESVGKALGKESELSINFKKKHEGTFEVNAINPVVAAVLYLKPPANINKMANSIDNVKSNNFDDWEIVSIESKVLMPVEAILSK